jgi:hypothetical protein
MDALKGEPRAILFIDNPDGRLQLVAFLDESWGIVRRGKTLCTWEADELTDCLRTFLDMAGRRAGSPPADRLPHATRDGALGTRHLRALQPDGLN